MITIRPATREDGDALFSLIEALADYERLPRPNEDARARLIQDGFERETPRFIAYLAEDDANPGGPVGYAITFETYSTFLAQPTLYIEDIFVKPEARGNGAGRELFAFLCAEALRTNCGRVEWVCLDWNRLAIDFYERRAAKHMAEWRYYRLDGTALQNFAVEE